MGEMKSQIAAGLDAASLPGSVRVLGDRGARLDKAEIPAPRAQDQVIEERDPEEFARLIEATRDVSVLFRRLELPRGVIMADDHGGRPVRKRVAEDLPRVYDGIYLIVVIVIGRIILNLLYK